MLTGKRIVVGVTGGIAAYKSAHLLRLLKREGAEVRVVMTRMAREFITPLTLATLSQHPVSEELFDPTDGRWNSHVSLSMWADLLVVAPATANTLAKMAHGVSDNLLLTTYLSARSPVLVAPAMDVDMYAHPATQSNLSVLRSRGVRVLEADSGFLASGLAGKGRMAEPETILSAVHELLLQPTGGLVGRKVLLTTGPTQEPLDPVRYITNRSSGRMGVALAHALLEAGAEVYCLTGPAQFIPQPHSRLHLKHVQTAQEMADAAIALWPEMAAAVLAAAVADYRPSQVSHEKIKRLELKVDLPLVANPDIAAQLGSCKSPAQRVVGFALETTDGLANALVKVERKRLDMCVINEPVAGVSGFDSTTNRGRLLFPDGHVVERELESKEQLAQAIVGQLAIMLSDER